MHIHTATHTIHANAKSDTLKLAESRKITANINTENILENQTSHELNVS